MLVDNWYQIEIGADFKAQKYETLRILDSDAKSVFEWDFDSSEDVKLGAEFMPGWDPSMTFSLELENKYQDCNDSLAEPLIGEVFYRNPLLSVSSPITATE